LLELLRFLSPEELATAAPVCRLLCTLASSDDVWQAIYLASFGDYLDGTLFASAKQAWLSVEDTSKAQTVVLLTPQEPYDVNKAATGLHASKRCCTEGVQLSTQHTLHYPASIDLGGVKGSGFRIPYSEQVSLGTADFTVEAWLRIDAALAGQTQGPYDCESCQDYMMMSFGWQARNRLGMDLYTSAAWHASHGTGLMGPGEIKDGYLAREHPCNVYNSAREKFWEACDGNFHHFAHVRTGNHLRLYQDGDMVADSQMTAAVDPQHEMFVGSQGNGNTYHPKELAEFRLIRGQARYQGNFTPSSSRFLRPNLSDDK
jgi:hypothetical protein